jgi:hypothetical protein
LIFTLITAFIHKIISEIIQAMEKYFPGFIMRKKNYGISNFLDKNIIPGKLKFPG